MDDAKQFQEFLKEYQRRAKTAPTVPVFDSIEKLKVIRTTYATGLMLFLNRMLKDYKANSPIHRELAAAVMLVKDAIRLIDIKMGASGRSLSGDEDSKLLERLNEINAQMEYFAVRYNKSKQFQKRIKAASDETGVSLGSLIQVTGQAMQDVPSLDVPSPEGSGTKGLKQGARQFGGDLRSSLINQGLGPLAPLGHLAWNTFSGIRQNRREKKIRTARNDYWARYGTSGMGIDPAGAEFAGEGRGQTRPIGDIFTPPGGVRAPTRQEREENTISGFFGREAFKKAWTKDIHTFLKKISESVGKFGGGGGGAGAGFLGGMMGGRFLAWLPRIIPFILPVIGVLAAALGSVMLGSWIDKRLQGTSAGGAVQKGFDVMAAGASVVGDGTAFGTSISNIALGGATGAGASLVSRRNIVKTAEQIGLSGVVGIGGMVGSLVEQISQSLKGIGDVVSGAMNTAVVSKSPAISPYKAADPLIDRQNRSD